MVDYSTVRRSALFELEVKRSRFIAYADPVADEAEVRARLTALGKDHPQCRHLVYAWRLGGFGEAQSLQRHSDAGEPAGSAGLPVLKKIEGLDLTQVLVSVVRYFGGILLGTGGLARAYAGAAEGALAEAGLRRMRRMELFDCVLPYAQFDGLRKRLNEAGFKLFDERFAAEVHCKLAAAAGETERLNALLREGLAGPPRLSHIGSDYFGD